MDKAKVRTIIDPASKIKPFAALLGTMKTHCDEFSAATGSEYASGKAAGFQAAIEAMQSLGLLPYPDVPAITSHYTPAAEPSGFVNPDAITVRVYQMEEAIVPFYA